MIYINVGDVSFGFSNSKLIESLHNYFDESSFSEDVPYNKIVYYIEPSGKFLEGGLQLLIGESENIFGSKYRIYIKNYKKYLVSANNKYGSHVFVVNNNNYYNVYYMFENVGDDVKWAIRLCRELLFKYYIENGYVPLHSSAVSTGGKGIMAIGERGSGKTTTLCALAKSGSEIISNDLVMVGIDINDKIKIIGWPWKISVGNALAQKIGYEIDPNFLKTEVWPKKLCSTFGCGWKWTENLSVILFPQIEVNKELKLKKSSSFETETFIKTHGIEYSKVFDIFTGVEYNIDFLKIIKKLSEKIPSYHLEGDIWKNSDSLRKAINDILTK